MFTYFGHVFNNPVWSEFLCQLFYIYHSLILSYYHNFIFLFCLIYNLVVISALFRVSTRFLQFLLSSRTFLSGFPQAAYYCPFFIPFSFCVLLSFLYSFFLLRCRHEFCSSYSVQRPFCPGFPELHTFMSSSSFR